MRDNRPPAPPVLDDAVESARLAVVARVYCQAKMLGEPAILSATQLEEVRAKASRRSCLGAAQ
jgi:hypothetical protein